MDWSEIRYGQRNKIKYKIHTSVYRLLRNKSTCIKKHPRPKKTTKIQTTTVITSIDIYIHAGPMHQQIDPSSFWPFYNRLSSIVYK